MTTNPFLSPDDPRLTAYALGELDENERAEIEAQLPACPAAQAAVEAIRATAAQLAAALAAEPLPAVAKPARKDPYARKPKGWLLRFPRVYYLTATLAAACFVVMVALHRPAPKPPAAENGSTRVFELNMPALPEPVASAPAAKEQRRQADAAMEREALRRAAQAEFARKREADRSAAVSMLAFRVAGEAAAPGALNTEDYAYRAETGFVRVANQPLSTFSADVDTASYANVRRLIEQGRRPPVDAVRVEEMLNYFPYHYAPPTDGKPFAASLEVAAAPWAPGHRLVRIGLQGREVTTAARPAANLVFLLDVSGSMRAPNKLPLVKQALRLLVERLRPDDRVAIVTYAGTSGLALPSTPARHAAGILHALDALKPEGSTNGAMGIQLAYDIAKANFVSGGINRVILCTDGDFNVGVSDEGGLTRLVEEKAKSGVALSVLGFGMGNYKDAMLEQLADKGDGNYGYIDTRREAEKLLVEQVNGTLVTIAKDVKLQVEFNPAQVASYRLIGYEGRRLQKEDFNNDKVDAGEIGAGHAVTALYEIVPAGAGDVGLEPGVDTLKYQPAKPTVAVEPLPHGVAGELLTLKVRYQAPEGGQSGLISFPLTDRGEAFANASADFKFAAAVAGCGMLLRDSPFKGATTLNDVEQWAQAGLGNDAGGYRGEFLQLVRRLEGLSR
jgi:Ca-activated chloride channel family protein